MKFSSLKENMTSSPERNYNSSDKRVIFLSEDESSASMMNNLGKKNLTSSEKIVRKMPF